MKLNYGKCMRDARKKTGETQESFATKLDISQTYLCQLEKGNKPPSRELLEKLCDLMKIRLSAFLLEVENNSNILESNPVESAL